MKQHKLSHPHKKEIIAAIESGEKWAWIQAEYKCSLSTISRFRRELGKYSPPQGLSSEQQSELIKQRIKGKSLKELSEQYGISKSRVSYIALQFTNRNTSL